MVQALVNHLWQDSHVSLCGSQTDGSWQIHGFNTACSSCGNMGLRLIHLDGCWHSQDKVECFSWYTNDTSTLCRLNRCQMAKNALWLSDVFSAEGNCVASHARSPEPIRSQYHWPHKHHMTQTDWTIWKRALKSTQHMIRLGQWSLPHEVYTSYPTLYSSTTGYLYRQNNAGQWFQYCPRHNTHRTCWLHFRLVGFETSLEQQPLICITAI